MSARQATRPAIGAGPYLLVGVLSLGVFLGALDQTVVVTALPSIIVDLEIPFSRLNEAAWIVTGYLLGYTVAMPLVGRVGDVVGHRRAYLGCIGCFALGSLLCARAETLEWLVLARLLQAAGGGAILPVTMAVVGEVIPLARRGLALGALGAVAEAGGVLGPLYGAAIVDRLDWRWIFLLNLPLCWLVAAAVLLWTPDHPGHGGAIDWPGGLLLALALAALTVGLSRESGEVQEPVLAAALVALALFLLVLFVLREGRTAQPLIDLRLFRRRPFAAANLVNLLVGAALITAMVDVPLFAATVLGRPAIDGGLLLMRLTVMIPLGAVVGGWLCGRLGERATVLLALACAAAGLLLMARWQTGMVDAELTPALLVAGFGFGLAIAPVNQVTLAWAGRERAGVASALITVMRMVGMMVGLSALTAWGLNRFRDQVAAIPFTLQVPGETAEQQAQRLAEYQARVLEVALGIFHEIFLAAALLTALAALPALWLRLQAGPGEEVRREEGASG